TRSRWTSVESRGPPKKLAGGKDGFHTPSLPPARFSSVVSCFISVDPLETPQGHVRGKVSTVISLGADRVAQPLQRLAADGDVVVIAAGVADGVPYLIKAVRFLHGFAQLPPAHQLDRQPAVEVLAVGAVKREQVADGGAVGEALAVADGRGLGQLL